MRPGAGVTRSAVGGEFALALGASSLKSMRDLVGQRAAPLCAGVPGPVRGSLRGDGFEDGRGGRAFPGLAACAGHRAALARGGGCSAYGPLNYMLPLLAVNEQDHLVTGATGGVSQAPPGTSSSSSSSSSSLR